MQQQDLGARYRLIESVYQRALDIKPELRGDFLTSTCGHDADLRHEVEQLIDHFRSAGSSFLDQPFFEFRDGDAAPERVPSRIGSFQIVRLLGRGGMGTVFEAQQESPRRRVAIKIVRDDQFSSEFQRRFRREANTLAKLQHPGIAQLFEFGSASACYGDLERPRQNYFAMELVDGEPITAFAAKHKLSIPGRLRLLIQLCEAVQHAHQKGVIHRDLKPANILVVDGDTHDESGFRVKVLDFGVARVLEASDGGLTRSNSGSLVGTIAYMSPEQLAEQSELVDTRSDVFSIGIVAYELLTGRLPIDIAGLSLVSAIHKLTEAPIPRAGAVCPELRGDIESILTKALEREPAHRYASAAEFGADIRRCILHEPLTVRRHSVSYLMSRFARRNRGAVAGLAIATLALLIGSGVAIAAGIRATQAADRAETEAARSKRVVEFLRQTLASVGPRTMHQPDVTVRQALDEAAAQLEAGQLHEEIEVECAVRATIGETYLGLGRYGAALTQLQEALELANGTGRSTGSELLALRNLVAKALCGVSRFDEAEKLHRETIAAAAPALGADPALAEMYCDLGDCLFESGKLDDARAAHERALTLLDGCVDQPPVIRARLTTSLGRDLQELGKLADAEPVLRAALALYKENLPAEHPDIAYSLSRLGWLIFRLHGNESKESETLLREALAIYRKTLDPENPELANCLNCLGMCIKTGRNPEAVALLREALSIREKTLGPDSPDVAESLMHLAHALTDFDESDEVRRLSERALEIRRKVFGAAHQQYAFSLHDVAVLHLSRGDAEPAIPLLRESLAILEERLGDGHDLVAHLRDSLGVALLSVGANAEALELLESALATRCDALDSSHPKIAFSLGNVAQARLRTGDLSGAIEAADSCVSVIRADPGEQARYARILLVRAEAVLQRDESTSDAIASDIAEAIEISRAKYGEQSLQVGNAMRVLVIHLLRSGEMDAARTELCRCARVLECVDRPDSAPAQLLRAQLDELFVALYDGNQATR